MSSAASFLRWVGVILLSFFMIFIVMPLLVVFTVSVFANSMSTKTAPGMNQVAVVELDGMILDSREVIDELYRQADDPGVEGIVLRINSPGGAIGPAQEIYSAVEKIKARKPVIASMGSVAASGGLYAALSATKIFCQPGTLTGSIGVILQIPNIKKIVDLVGFQMTTVKSGSLKDAGNVFREMSDSERNYLQSTVDIAHQQFVDAVATSRKLDPASVNSFSDGRIVLGSEAVKIGLVDGFGDVDTAARAVFEELKRPLSPDVRPQLIYPMDKTRWIKEILQSTTHISDLVQGKVQFQYLLQ